MIDWNKAQELRDDIGEEGFDEIIGVFLEEVEEALEKLPVQAPCELGATMHFLKGSALNLGFEDFASKCLDGETLANAGNPDEIDLGAVQESYHKSKAIFLKHFGIAP